jgi:DNA polymerase III delta prime subunit
MAHTPVAVFQVYSWLGVEPPRGVLLHGPPGCGKTALAHAIATECGVPFLRVSAPEVVSGMSGESEARLRQLFQVGGSLVAACMNFVFFDAATVARVGYARNGILVVGGCGSDTKVKHGCRRFQMHRAKLFQVCLYPLNVSFVDSERGS